MYEIENSGEYIVPERLPPTKPDYSWDKKDNLSFRYEYDYFIPKGIMSQFIVQMYRNIYNHNHVWGRGVILQRENTSAEIVESDDSRIISIKIVGKSKRDFMTIIIEKLDKILSQFEKMKVEKLIPCNCKECKTNDKPHFYQYKDLKYRIERGRDNVECGRSYEMTKVRSLIGEVIDESMHGRNEEENICESQKVERDTVFISYSQKDWKLLERVHEHLNALKNLGIALNVWDDTKIKAGQKWLKEIKRALASAKVAILMVSTNFLGSEFINKKEIPPLLEAAEKEGAAILPLILKPCLFTAHKELSKFQAVNKPSEALSKLSESEQDEILVSLSERIMDLIHPPKKETV
ncbi:MAG: TIR domain-containing protein [Desulfobacteraceae bacterium]|nr:TIR domain-containing protein [Desulfobacteraceae bacterium]